MPRFFIPAGDRPPADGGQVRITGADAVHIRRSLRMREGETLFPVSYTHLDVYKRQI